MMPLVFALLFALAPQLETSESYVVRRVLVDARLADPYGKAIVGLNAEDFQVAIGDQQAQVLSVRWIPESAAGREMAARLPGFDPSEPDAPPRLFIFFFQTDWGRAWQRVRGEMAFLPYAEKIADELPANDRVAVFSYDSQLRFRLDFTSDKAQIKRAMSHVLEISDPPEPPRVDEPALARRLDRDAMRRATSTELALTQLATALESIPGKKQIILFGHGLGTKIGSRGFTMLPEWNETQQKLNDADVTVNVIYTPHKFAGQLMLGLRTAAKETGGFFLIADTLPQQSVDRVSHGVLAGHYEVEVRPPDSVGPGTYDLELRVAKKDIVQHATITLRQ